MISSEADKWRQASEEEFEGLTEMGIWKLVPRPNDQVQMDICIKI